MFSRCSNVNALIVVISCSINQCSKLVQKKGRRLFRLICQHKFLWLVHSSGSMKLTNLFSYYLFAFYSCLCYVHPRNAKENLLLTYLDHRVSSLVLVCFFLHCWHKPALDRFSMSRHYHRVSDCVCDWSQSKLGHHGGSEEGVGKRQQNNTDLQRIGQFQF